MLLFPLSNFTHVLNRLSAGHYLVSAESRILGRSMDASCIQFGRRPRPMPRSSQSECTPQSHYKIYCFIRIRRNRIRGGERLRTVNGLYFVVCLPFVVLSPSQTVRWSPTAAKEISGFVGGVLVPPSLHKTFRFACSTIICVQIARARSDENYSPLYNEGKEGGGWEMSSGGLIFTPSITSLSLRLFQVCQLACPT